MNICILFVVVICGVYVQYCESDECDQPLLVSAKLTATSSLREREPNNARLNGESAWTPINNTYYHFLTVNFESRKEVVSVVSQGRTSTLEYVTEYIVQYSDDGEIWKSVADPLGDIEMFKGNINGDDVRENRFEVPIIAQWVRINPTRWRDRISLRIELYGCDYVSKNWHFNGTAMLQWELRDEVISATRETIRFRFKTTTADGVILYSRGTQGDFLALQLKDNRMLLNIDLGSGMMTSLSVGSLLDDNIWHDVIISRNRRDIMFSVDRVQIHSKIRGEFLRLNLNREMYIGGVPNKQDGLVVVQNFTGCLENLFVNTTNMMWRVLEAYENDENWAAEKFKKFNVHYSCPEPPIIPVTFVSQESHAKLAGYEGMTSLNISFSFRTYEEDGLLVYHKFTTQGFLKLYLEKGKIKVQLEEMSNTNPRTILDNYNEKFNDGRWHPAMLTVSTNNLVLTVDNKPMKTTRLLDMHTGPEYLIGGGVYGSRGFVGCMRLISVDGNYKLPTDWKKEDYSGHIVFDTCQMMDRCNPNPCKHGGVCDQNSIEFICDCSGTGYSGAVCHTSLNPLSCEAYKNAASVGQRAEIKIDVDGSGPLKPFPVTCEYYADGRIVTVLHHRNEDETPVDGFQEPGSFVQNIIYDADGGQIEAFINRSTSCWQSLSYSCHNSRLFNSPSSSDQQFQPMSWWVSRHNQKMDYWGGSIPGSRKCYCGIMGDCKDGTKWCNCDAGFDDWQEDGGDITEKEHLPVRQLRFGDTGSPLDDKAGKYRLGPLLCEGDDLFNNVVTFLITDATIDLPTFDLGHSGDIYFEFRTTIMNAVILHSKGPTDFIKVSILGGNTLQFTYQAGSGPLGVSVDSSHKLADNNWHSVSIERNRKEARIVVDGALKTEVREPPGPVRALHLTTNLVIGANTDYRDGFTGCIRALLLNGRHVDLVSYAKKGLYGVTSGCVGKCESNPCLNNGTCHEKYDGYWCDCRWTAFKGPICADEIGVNMRASSIVKYDFMGSWRSTISENIRVGFTTTNPKGFLLGFFSNITGEYLTIMISNSGHLRVVFDFGFERQELIFPNKHFGMGQYHDVRISRKNSGATLLMQVDSYEPKEFHFNIKESADAQFNNIQTMYIGRNESMSEGFVGCISRVEFDDIYPLKLLFQEDGPPNVRSLGSPLTEDFCGVEPVTHPPDIKETRPPLNLDKDLIENAHNRANLAILGGVLAILILALILMAILIGRYVARHKGEYLTQEDKGADIAMDPDSAVVHSTTGHQIHKRREWFI